MAFFTFTTVSGTAATNNLVQQVTATPATTSVTIKLVDGIVTYFDAAGNFTSTGNPLSAYAPAGIAAVVDATGTLAPTIISAGLTNVGTDLGTYQTSGFTSKLNLTNQTPATNKLSTIDAAGATSGQIDTFIASHSAAANNSLINASINVTQWDQLTAATLVKAGGVLALDATGATALQSTAIATEMAIGAASDFTTGSVSNLTLASADFNAVVAGTAASKFAAEGATINGTLSIVGGAGALDVNTLVTNVAANIAKVNNVTAVGSIGNGELNNNNFNLFASQVVAGGVAKVIGTTGATALSAANWNSLNAFSSILANGSIGLNTGAATDAGALSVNNFVALANKFVDGTVGVANAAGMFSLYGASSSQVDSVAANVAKLTTEGVEEANITPAQFAILGAKIGNGEATVNAANATAAQVTVILNQLDAFNNALSTDGVAHAVTNLTISGAQFAAVNVADLNAAMAGTLNVDSSAATSGVSFSTGAFSHSIQVVGSTYADAFTFTGLTTANGGMGADLLDARLIDGVGFPVVDVSLAGGNAIDTIYGGDGNDYLTSGKGTQNYLQGGNGVGNDGDDTFLINASTSTPGLAGHAFVNGLNTGDTLIQWAGSTVDAYTTGFVATNSTSNNAAATINAGTYNIATKTATVDAAGTAINMTQAVGTNGFTIVGGTGSDTLTGSSLADAIRGGSGMDTIVGGAGADTLTGGNGADTFQVTSSATDIITDLSGVDTLPIVANANVVADALIVNAGSSVLANVSANWVAGAAVVAAGAITVNRAVTENNGTATLDVANSVNVDLTLAQGANGFTLDASGNSVGSELIGSAKADTFLGSNGTDFILGGLGIDTIVLGADSSTDTVELVSTVANLSTLNRDIIGGFAGGVQGDVIQVDGGVGTGFTAYNAAGLYNDVVANVATLGLLGIGGADSANAGVNYVVVDTSANLMAANLSVQFAGKGVLAYATDTGSVYFDANGNFGDGSAVLIGVVQGAPALTADNFNVI